MQASHFLRQAKHLQTTTVAWTDVSELDLLPQRLWVQLRYDIFAGCLKSHPLFAKVDELHRPLLLEICMDAVHEQVLVSDSDLFLRGAVASKMFFVRRGALYLSDEVEMAHGIPEMLPFEVLENEWICEAALWIKWVHQLTSRAGKFDTILLSISADDFSRVAKEHPRGFDRLKYYGQSWLEHFTELWEYSDEADDCWIDVELLRGLVTSTFSGDAKLKTVEVRDRECGRSSKSNSLKKWTRGWSFRTMSKAVGTTVSRATTRRNP